MKRLPLLILCLLLPLSGWALPTVQPADIAELHWLPQTADEARIRTYAAAQWLADPSADPQRWRQQVEVRSLTLARRAVRRQPLQAADVDGVLGWLVQARALGEIGSPESLSVLSDSLARGISRSLFPEAVADPVADATFRAEEIWRQVHERLADSGWADPDLELSAFWAGLVAVAEAAETFERAGARTRSRLAAEMIEQPESARLSSLGAMAFSASLISWQRGDDLGAIWQLLESLVLALAADPPALLSEQRQLIGQMAESGQRRLMQTDRDLPVVLALLEDAASFLDQDPSLLDAAVGQLVDAYFRLALFTPDAAFYLDQPVRDQLRQVLDECRPLPDLVGPLPREVFEQCPARLFSLLENALASEELVGDAGGPFAPEFLRREMGLVSWQRARYVDAYLNWQLQADCEPVEWSNPLEWSILVQALVSWVPQRPVFFGTERWQVAMRELIERIEEQEAARSAWVDCMSGQGGQRLDPVSRLLVLHGRALADLRLALDVAYQRFTEEHTRPGSDVDLDGDADQITAYRPEGLSVRPCPGGATCGARVELPVSRALLGLFPNTYLLADQLGIGRLALCYDEVRWEDREMLPARPGDDRVANFHGRLAFDLIGTFDDGSGPETVFRQRLTAMERRHYLFAEASVELLEQACPTALAGDPIASALPADRRFGLVPNRLTYFASTPTTAGGQLQANWSDREEWRDWFLSPGRVELLEMPRPAPLQARVQAELESLVVRRERALAANLLRNNSEDPLAAAMAAVVDTSALLRRVLELHYPRLIRHDGEIRALLTGTETLLGRESVRLLREQARSMAELPEYGLAYLSSLQELWQRLPASLREQGQPSPESEHALVLLQALREITLPAAFSDESSPDQ